MIQATLKTVTCDVSNNTQANLIMRMVVLDKGTQVMDKTYKTTGHIPFLSFDVTCSDPLGKAIEDMVKKFPDDLDEYTRS